MIGVTAKDVIDRAITLEEGKSIVIPCSSYDEMEKLRPQLYKRKKTLEKAYKRVADTIYISREIKEDSWTLFITKQKRAEGAFIITQDGGVEPFYNEGELAGAGAVGEEGETERMTRLMQEDGMGEEEIATALAEKGEEDFDKAASKIEEAQAIASKGKKKKKGGEK